MFSLAAGKKWFTINMGADASVRSSELEFPLSEIHPLNKIISMRRTALVLPAHQVTTAFSTVERKKEYATVEDTKETSPLSIHVESKKPTPTLPLAMPRSLKPVYLLQEFLPPTKAADSKRPVSNFEKTFGEVEHQKIGFSRGNDHGN
jgi:hypothetical protein